jgi:hypothetical protein
MKRGKEESQAGNNGHEKGIVETGEQRDTRKSLSQQQNARPEVIVDVEGVAIARLNQPPVCLGNFRWEGRTAQQQESQRRHCPEPNPEGH